MKIRKLGCALLVLSACADPGFVVAIDSRSLPDDVSEAAILLLSGSTLISATPVLALDPEGLRAEIDRAAIDSAERVLVIAYPAGALGPTGVTRTEQPLRLRQRDEPELPPPAHVWSAKLGEARSLRLEPAIGEPLPSLTVEWLPRCLELVAFEHAITDTSCELLEACNWAKPSVEGCRLHFNELHCAAELAGQGDGHGGVTLDSMPFSCQGGIEAPAPGEPILSAGCSGPEVCRIDLHLPSGQPLVELAATRRLLEAPDRDPPGAPVTTHSGGYLFGLALTGSVLVVGDRGGAFSDRGCAGSETSRLSFLDSDTLDVIRTATAPPCLVALAPDARLGVIAAFAGPELRVARFDDQGHPLESVTLPRGAAPIDAEIIALTRIAEPGCAFLGALITGGMPPMSRSFVAALDPTTLQPRWVSDNAAGDAIAVACAGHDLLALLTRLDDSVRLLDLNTGATVRDIRLSVCGSDELFAPTSIEYLPSASSLAIGVDGYPTAAMRFLFDPAVESGCTRARFYERSADPTSIVRMHGGDDRLLVGLASTGNERVALLSLFDPLARRFLEGALEIGRGPVTELTSLGLGSVYGLLPWSATVFRVHPRP